MIRDSILSEIELNDDLTKELRDKFFKGMNISNDENKANYLKQNLLDENDLNRITTSTYRLNKISLKLFGDKASDFFEKREKSIRMNIFILF